MRRKIKKLAVAVIGVHHTGHRVYAMNLNRAVQEQLRHCGTELQIGAKYRMDKVGHEVTLTKDPTGCLTLRNGQNGAVRITSRTLEGLWYFYRVSAGSTDSFTLSPVSEAGWSAETTDVMVDDLRALVVAQDREILELKERISVLSKQAHRRAPLPHEESQSNDTPDYY